MTTAVAPAPAQCEYCAAPLTGRRQKWCGVRCNRRAAVKHDHQTKQCRICSKPLTGQRRVAYCGEECYKHGLTLAKRESSERRRLALRKGRKCEQCDAPLPKGKKAYCSKECAHEVFLDLHREYKARKAASRRGVVSSVSVGDCKWCNAQQAETPVFFYEADPEAGKFINGGECRACLDKKKKSVCAKCKGPSSKTAGCVRCDPAPAGHIDIVVMNDKDLRERVVRKAVYNSSRPNKRNGKIKVWRHLFFPREGLTVTLPLSAWKYER